MNRFDALLEAKRVMSELGFLDGYHYSAKCIRFFVEQSELKKANDALQPIAKKFNIPIEAIVDSGRVVLVL